MESGKFGRHNRRIAVGAIASCVVIVVGMFFFVPREDWSPEFETPEEGVAQGEKKPLNLDIRGKRGKKKRKPFDFSTVAKREAMDPPTMTVASVSFNPPNAGEALTTQQDLNEFEQQLVDSGQQFIHGTNGYNHKKFPMHGHAANFGPQMGTGNYPVNHSTQYVSNMPTSASNVAEQSGETTHPEDDELQDLWDCKACPRMVIIPSGNFVMGAPDTEPDHELAETPQVDVSVNWPFAMSKFEISRYEYEQFIYDTGYKRKGICEKKQASFFGGVEPDPPLEPSQYDMPVLCVTFQDAVAYANWLSLKTGLNYRLPSAAEWEYAARAQTKTAYYFGEKLKRKDARFLASLDGVAKPAETTEYKPNAFHLYNMHGNAAEWVSDCWHTNLSEAPDTQDAWTERGDCDFRLTKGGSWLDGVSDLRSAARGRQIAKVGTKGTGFRVVRDIYTNRVDTGYD